MSLPNFSMRRPVTIIMFFSGIILFGLISWTRLQQELYPPITYPQLSVITFYKDAAPEEMEILVTKPVEEAVGTVSGVRRISSISKEETSLVVAEFNWGTNMDFAALGVREKIDLIKESLPRGSEDPIVMKFNPFELPLLVLNITADNIDPAELRQITSKIIKNEIEKADGVAAANITGGRIPEVLVNVDQDRLMSKGLALNKVVEAISKANLNYPAGTIEESFYEYLIRTIGEFQVVDEIANVVIGLDDRRKKSEFTGFGPYDQSEADDKSMPHTRLIFLREIATVKETLKERTSISRFNNQDNISLSVQKQADANTLHVANNVKGIIARLKSILPKGISINIVADQSIAINTNVRGVRDAALQGGLLAFLVLLFFLRNVKSAAIVALNIPVSMMVVFALMFLSGITINMISLGGLALGVGMLVDNGIVVIENIYRYRQEEKRPVKEASICGANEVSGAIAGSTLTTIAVFLPMIFVVGIAGQICKDLAFTVTFSLLGSLVAALTLIPILSAKVDDIPTVGVDEEKGIAGAMLGVLQNFTQRVLVFFIDNKRLCLIAVLIVFIGSCLLLPFLDTELMPKVDQGQFTIKLDLPPGTRVDFTDTVVKRIESYLFEMPEVDSVTVNIGSTKEKKGTALLETMGSHQAQIIVNLKPKSSPGKTGPEYRFTSTAGVLQKIKDQIGAKELSGATVEYILQESVFQSAFQAGAPIVVEIKGQELNILRNITSDVEAALKTIPGIYSIRNTLVAPAPEVKVNVFKDKAATYNLSTSDIALTAQTAVKGYIATKFKQEGEEIDIKVQLQEKDRDNMAKVRQLQLNSPLGIDVPLSELAYLSIGRGPSEIKRQDQERMVAVSASIFQRSFKEVADTITAMLSNLKISSGYSAQLTGEREQIQESFRSLQMALILSILLVYMIMASQFESLWQPFVILFTIPLSIIGVIAILLITKTPLSVMVILGVIVLGGVVVNNGIVLIDYTNILRDKGMNAYDAVITASRRRLRPIIMTALTTILGLVPLAFALNEGAELQQPMAIAVIGGLAVSTFLSLIVIPTIYLGLDSMISSVMHRGIKPEAEDEGGDSPITPPGPDSGPGQMPLPEAGLEISVPEPVQDIPSVEPEPRENRGQPGIQYEDDIMEQPMPKTGHIDPDEITPPIILPYESDKADDEIAEGSHENIPVQPEEEKADDTYHDKQPDMGQDQQDLKPEKPDNLGLGFVLIDSQGRPKASSKDIKPEDETSQAGFSQRQKDLIEYLKTNKRITRKEYADTFKISIPTAARDLKQLSDLGIILPKGPAAIGRYYVLK
jgi:hydrophobic/amphiphilic exporter-1 (mainly G- bacteria), HAE1 family